MQVDLPGTSSVVWRPEGVVSVKVTPRMRTNSGDTCRVAELRN